MKNATIEVGPNPKTRKMIKADKKINKAIKYCTSSNLKRAITKLFGGI